MAYPSLITDSADRCSYKDDENTATKSSNISSSSSKNKRKHDGNEWDKDTPTTFKSYEDLLMTHKWTV
ncbi:hypothetical protein X798_04593 [Onchocerca flexuosa]|uniref:Uncharacterized protein n=2 Tax=Onchocerca flexuosa TaxID=387005 RepID=A0A183I0K6_9BILA|nr:hypothetical protein X798_04593 [Onchocerca flexuosa]VDP13318.1 unnamed protein product [Onchocerca flexuosa]